MKKIGPVTDKDFDKAFHEKLYSMAIEPADSVWQGISEQLNRTKKKRPFPILWLAAASMAAVIGVGVWLSSQKEPMKLTGTVGAEIEERNVQAAPSSADTDIKTSSSVKERIALLQIPKSIIKRKKRENLKVISSDAVVLAQAPSFKETKPVVSLEDTSSETEIHTKTAVKETPALALAEPEIATEEPQLKEKKIKSVGSLVNFVVSKVDKRKNKIIEFEDGDEGTMVSGLNLGLLKFQAKQ
jgi:hypothetical protein